MSAIAGIFLYSKSCLFQSLYVEYVIGINSLNAEMVPIVIVNLYKLAPDSSKGKYLEIIHTSMLDNPDQPFYNLVKVAHFKGQYSAAGVCTDTIKDLESTRGSSRLHCKGQYLGGSDSFNLQKFQTTLFSPTDCTLTNFYQLSWGANLVTHNFFGLQNLLVLLCCVSTERMKKINFEGTPCITSVQSYL